MSWSQSYVGEDYKYVDAKKGVDDAGLAKLRKAADDAEANWVVAENYALTYHQGYVTALQTNTVAAKAWHAVKDADGVAIAKITKNYLDVNATAPYSMLQPYATNINKCDQFIDYLAAERKVVIADMAANITLVVKPSQQGSTTTLVTANPEAAAKAVDQAAKDAGQIGARPDGSPQAPAPDPPVLIPPEGDMVDTVGWVAAAGAIGYILFRVLARKA